MRDETLLIVMKIQSIISSKKLLPDEAMISGTINIILQVICVFGKKNQILLFDPVFSLDHYILLVLLLLTLLNQQINLNHQSC